MGCLWIAIIIYLLFIIRKRVQLSNFQSFNFPATIEKALGAMHFHTPTPIQSQAIPVVLSGKDLVGCAQTGTGKTAAFCLPILTQFTQNRSYQGAPQTALILVPTRELALQIDLFWKKLTQFSPGNNSAVIIGGTSMRSQIKSLARLPRLIIATPGRLVDHIQRRTVQLSKVSFLVLDEADRMLDMGFAPQLSQIVNHIPSQRQTLFFTATWAQEMDQLARKFLRNPVRVTVGTVSRPAAEINQTAVMTTHDKKNDVLLDEINRRNGSILIFTRTKSRTDRVTRYLSEYGVPVGRLHGGRTQGQRNAALADFRSGEVRVLVATDIAARGIDVAKIGHVVNYDLPQSSEDYVHRIGRTGRAGEKGEAVSLLTPEDRQQWNYISSLIKKSGSQVPAVQKAQDSLEPKPERKPVAWTEDSDERSSGRFDRRSGRRPGRRGEQRFDSRSDRRSDRKTEHRYDRRPEPRDAQQADQGSFRRDEERSERRFEGRPDRKFGPRSGKRDDRRGDARFGRGSDRKKPWGSNESGSQGSHHFAPRSENQQGKFRSAHFDRPNQVDGFSPFSSKRNKMKSKFGKGRKEGHHGRSKDSRSKNNSSGFQKHFGVINI